ncbi:QcrA and Rieske domain-containing protein [Nocardia sp. NPDC003693]
MTEHAPASGIRFDRRTALAATGAAATALTVAACSSSGGSSSSDTAGTDKGRTPTELARTADVPVGGALIAGDTVITQPTAGSFQGFSSTCTHLGCKVTEINAATIRCACHNSSFNLDGTVASGPAPRPLDTRAIRVDGDRIVSG